MSDGYINGSGIGFTQDRQRNTVSIEITDEELIRNAAVRHAVRVIAIYARHARTVETTLPVEQPTQPALDSN